MGAGQRNGGSLGTIHPLCRRTIYGFVSKFGDGVLLKYTFQPCRHNSIIRCCLSMPHVHFAVRILCDNISLNTQCVYTSSVRGLFIWPGNNSDYTKDLRQAHRKQEGELLQLNSEPPHQKIHSPVQEVAWIKEDANFSISGIAVAGSEEAALLCSGVPSTIT